MLEIKDLCVKVADKEILKNFNLSIKDGEIHAIMGPNGSGKSTLSYVIAGKSGYDITSGEIIYNGINITHATPEQRAKAGIFLGFQYPIEIAGVAGINFLRTALNALKKERGEAEIDTVSFLKYIKEKSKILGIDDAMVKRALNVGFSGGEKKRFEILQMLVLDPSLVILDEIDSGLDIDALKVVASGVNVFKDKVKSVLMITHYQRLLNYIEPDFIHIMVNGKIVKSGDKKLAHELESLGYDQYR